MRLYTVLVTFEGAAFITTNGATRCSTQTRLEFDVLKIWCVLLSLLLFFFFWYGDVRVDGALVDFSEVGFGWDDYKKVLKLKCEMRATFPWRRLQFITLLNKQCRRFYCFVC